MIDDSSPPRGFEFGPGGGDQPAGLTGDDQKLDTRSCKYSSSSLGQVQGVRRRAHHHRGPVFEKEAQARLGGHPAAGQAEVTRALCRLEGRPEAEKWAEGKGEKDSLAR